MSVARSGEPRVGDESKALYARRGAAGLEPPGATDDRWGLALSGGGIRSATFCLGMVRGLAGHRLLRRFDYLSTVSGGGYLGASLGRLFRPGVPAADVEQGVAGERSLWLWWLRANSRYLTPSGARDLAQAGVSIARGAVATQLELGILLILVSTVLVLPHALVTLWPALQGSWTAGLVSAWWLLAPVPFFLGTWRLFEYWLSRPCPVPGGVWWMPLHAAGLAALGLCVTGLDALIAVLPPKMGEPFANLPMALRAMLATLLFAAAWAMLSGLRAARRIGAAGDDAEYALRTRRNLLTHALLRWTLVFLAVLAAGVVDRLSWELAGLAGDARSAGMVYGSAGFAAFGLVLFRALMPAFQQWKAKNPGHQLRLDRLLGVVVSAMLAVIVLGWATLVHALVLPERLWELGEAGADPAAAMYGGLVWSALFFGSLAFVYVTRNSDDIVNMASLHSYYRSRIERAYVSSGNVGGASPRFRDDPLAPIDDGMPRARPPDEVVAGDDVLLADYAPQSAGGPIHLINCCINQTVDDGTRYFNGDRKGVALTLASTGTIEIGPAAPERQPDKIGYLSKWIAISGAAAGSGMGYQTAPAYSALLFLSGMRLGYWERRMSGDHHGRVVDAPEDATSEVRGRRRSLVTRLPIKVSAIVSELLGQFPGLEHRAWYVSDGGHFENTAVYPLIKRELPLIVAADCGADPKYLFEDLESLVRKVRIDFGAEIEFIAPEDIDAPLAPDLKPLLGTPESIDPEPADACLVLARIRYRSGAVGTLLVVKPRRLNHLPFDVVAYADRNAAFPQQSTGDQFFDEAQWESYQRLGHLIGGRLTPATIAQAQAVVASDVRASSRLVGAEKSREQARARVSRIRPTVTATAAGTGLGLSLMVALWQGWSEYRENRQQEVEKAAAQGRTLVAEISQGRVPADASSVLALLLQQRVEGVGSRAAVLEALEACSRRGVPDCALLQREIAENEARAQRDYWRSPHASQAPAMPVAVAATVVGVRTDDEGQGAATGHTTADPVEPPASGAAPDDASPPPGDVPVLATSPAVIAPARDAEDSLPGQATACAGRRVYLHIYDETSRAAATALAGAIESGLGQRPVGIENVVASAMRKGQRAPQVWPRPAVLFGEEQRDRVEVCAKAIASAIDGQAGTKEAAILRPLQMRTARDAVEVWLPPRWRAP